MKSIIEKANLKAV